MHGSLSVTWKLECYEQVKRRNFTCSKKVGKLEVAILGSIFALPLLLIGHQPLLSWRSSGHFFAGTTITLTIALRKKSPH